MKSAFKGQASPKYISFTAPTAYWYLRWFPIGQMAEAADYVNFMTYDLHGVWDRDDPIGNQVLVCSHFPKADITIEYSGL